MNMKKLWLILLSAMLIFGFSAVASFADDVEAQNDGQTIAMIGDVEYPSLRAAVAAASSGDTIIIIADDAVSFANGGKIVIDKSLTIAGEYGKDITLFGKSQWTNEELAGAAAHFHGVEITGNGTVNITNLTLKEFGDKAYLNKHWFTPIFANSSFSGTLNLTDVNVSNFNREGIVAYAGKINISGGTVLGNNDHQPMGSQGQAGVNHFQQCIEIRDTAEATITGTSVVTTVADNAPDYSQVGIVSWSTKTAILENVVVDVKGVGVEPDVGTIIIIGEKTSVTADEKALFVEDGGMLRVSEGTFLGTVAVDSNDNSDIQITGGSFSERVDQFIDSSNRPAGVVSDTEGNSAFVVGEELLQDYAVYAENAIVITQGSIDFDQGTTQAALANEGNGTVTVGEKLVGTTSQEMAKLNEKVKEDAEKIAALEEAQKKAEADAAAAKKKADAQLAAAYTPVAVALKSVKKGKKKATVTFKRVEGQNIKYEIQFTNKTTNEVKKVTMNQGKKQTLKKTVKGLKKKTTYVVQVRAFNKVNGKTYYGKWSKKRNVKIK